MPKKRIKKITLTDHVPEDNWSDVRIEYIRNGKSIAEIAREKCCDKRTISRLIKENRSFSSLGRKQTPFKIDGFQNTIETALKNGTYANVIQITAMSKALFDLLRPLGYTGSERTIRDYLQTIPWEEWTARLLK